MTLAELLASAQTTVVDRSGQPLRVYRCAGDAHGVHRRDGASFWTDEQEVAELYCYDASPPGKPVVVHVVSGFLTLKNPFILENDRDARRFAGWLGVEWDGIDPYFGMVDRPETPEVLRTHGYDGMRFEDEVYEDGARSHTTWFVLSPSQVRVDPKHRSCIAEGPDSTTFAPRAGSRAKRPLAYHLGYAADLPSLRRAGLTPQKDTAQAWGSTPGLYFTNRFGHEGGAPESEAPLWLRFPWPEDHPLPGPREAAGEWRTSRPIPPSNLEIRVDIKNRPTRSGTKGRWVPLFREYTVAGVYVSGDPTPRLIRAIRTLSPEARAGVRALRRAEDSCDANAEVWAALLQREGWKAEQVFDGVAHLDQRIWHEDSEAWRYAIGHDWVVVLDGGNKVIVDGSIAQFQGQIPRYEQIVYRPWPG